MASVQTSAYGGRYLKLTVIEESTSITSNTSTIRWTLESVGGSATYYSIYNCKVVVNGSTVYNPGTVRYTTHNFPAAKGSKSGTITVKHNSNGTASPISFALHGRVYYSGDENKTGTLSLSNIPQAPKYNSTSCGNITETSVKLTASINTYGLSTTNGGWDLSTDGGNTWTFYSGDITSKTISGLNSNTKYWYRSYCVTAGGSTNSSWGTFTTYDYPHCTDSPNFNIGDTLTLKFYNPLGRTFNAKILGDDGSQCGNDTRSGTTISGYNNANCVDAFYASIPNKNTGNYQVQVTYGNSVKTKTGGKYYTKTSECLPVFDYFTVKDGNSDIVNVTENDQVFVKGYSLLWVTIPDDEKMVTKKSSTPNYYNIAVDTHSDNISWDYRTNDIIFNVGNLLNSGTLRVNVRAFDSRNNSVLASEDINVLDYNKPNIKIDAKRLNNFEDETIINISGSYTPLHVDNVDKNTITALKYRYREVGGDWGNWVTLNVTIVNNNFSCSEFILLLDKTKTFEIESQVDDNLDYSVNSEIVEVGEPIFFISSNTKKCYNNGDVIATLQMLYPIGAIYMSTVNTSPDILFGFGTWEEIEGKFLIGADSTYTAGTNGGQDEHTHSQGSTGGTILQQENLPARAVVLTKTTVGNSTSTDSVPANNQWSFHCLYDSGEPHGYPHSHTNTNTNTASNIPPYFAVHIWHRIA